MSSAAALRVQEHEVQISAIRAQGSGGQNVNKVSSAIHLRFDIGAASLSPAVKARLLALHDSRITEAGVLVIKSQAHRSQELNRLEAFSRLHELVNSVAHAPKARRATQPSQGERQRRRQAKRVRAETKAQRAPVRRLDGG